MKSKALAGLMTILFLVSITTIASPVSASPTIWHVSDGDSIQDAIDAASPYDTIIVHPGSYDGFEANVEGITIKAAWWRKPVISGTGITIHGQVVGVLVTADYVTIKGLSVTGSYSTGIWVLDGADHVKILMNKVDQTGFDPAVLPEVTWDGSAIQSHGDETYISMNLVKFGFSSRPHNGINVFYKNYEITENWVVIFEGRRYQVGINVRGNVFVAKNIVKCPDKTVGVWTRVFGIWLYGLDQYSPATLTGIVKKNSVYKTDYAIWVTGTKWDSNTVIMKNILVNNGIGIILENGASPALYQNWIKYSWWADIYP